jgi:hypothetical protein
MSITKETSSGGDFSGSWGLFGPAMEYMIDAAQRSVLFWDVMRQRGNQYREHLAETAPNVLDYEVELIVDGRKLERPVNYALVRIVPPPGVQLDPTRRPFVVVDPRAGHGPGIGGFKADSEIGVAMRAGHPCYLVGFLPEPVPGQIDEGARRRLPRRRDPRHQHLVNLGHPHSLDVEIPRASSRGALLQSCAGHAGRGDHPRVADDRRDDEDDRPLTEKIGKKARVSKDSYGFVVDLALVPMIDEAIDCVH